MNIYKFQDKGDDSKEYYFILAKSKGEANTLLQDVVDGPVEFVGELPASELRKPFFIHSGKLPLKM